MAGDSDTVMVWSGGEWKRKGAAAVITIDDSEDEDEDAVMLRANKRRRTTLEQQSRTPKNTKRVGSVLCKQMPRQRSSRVFIIRQAIVMAQLQAHTLTACPCLICWDVTEIATVNVAERYVADK
jgi:hypothetical protein